MKFQLDNRKVPNGTVLIFGISYPGDPTDPDAMRGRTEPRVFTYVMLKAAGVWYVTGSGKVPVSAGWGAVQRWLEKDGREVEWVDAVTSRRRVWPPEGAPIAAPEPVVRPVVDRYEKRYED